MAYSCDQSQNIKLAQYVHLGEKGYKVHCANCHQADGTGLTILIPPLNNEFGSQNLNFIVCGIKYGIEGSISVDGQKFDGIMPSNPQLTNLEIAEIVTYITNSWGNKAGITDVKTVDRMLSSCPN